MKYFYINNDSVVLWVFLCSIHWHTVVCTECRSRFLPHHEIGSYKSDPIIDLYHICDVNIVPRDSPP